jgi:HEXXH motif-containing protein
MTADPSAPLAPAAPQARTLSPVQLPWATVDQLAAGRPDEAALGALLAAERSHRAVLLRAVLDAARAAGPAAIGPLAGVDEAWDLLAAAERAEPDQVLALVGRPQVGAWAAHALRRLRPAATGDAAPAAGGPAAGLDDSPLWAHVGQLHTLAAAAAVRAGLRTRIDVPSWFGQVVLPTLGTARGPYWDVWEPATVAVDGGTFWVGTARWRAGPTAHTDEPAGALGGAVWRGRPLLRLGPEGEQLTVDVDDSSFYRLGRGLARPTRTRPATLRRWEVLLDEAWSVLRATDPVLAAALALATTSIVPLPAEGGARVFSASSGDALGAVALSEPGAALDLAAALVHEFGHAQLGVLLHLADVVSTEPPGTEPAAVPAGGAEPGPALEATLYAPWRDDPRPLPGFAQGTFAFFGVAGFWRARTRMAAGQPAATAYFELALWRGRVRAALRRLRDDPRLTPFGARLFDGVAATVAGWAREPVPPDLEALARTASADHLGRWRAHHVVPPAELVEALASAWRAGSTLPAAERGWWHQPDQVSVDAAARDLDAVAAATRIWLTDRDRLRAEATAADRAGAGVGGGTDVPGAAPADLALVAGRRDLARTGYLAELTAGAGRPGAWTGLGRLLAADGEAAAARALLVRPEVVRAVAVALRAGGDTAHPVTLAAWIGGQLP